MEDSNSKNSQQQLDQQKIGHLDRKVQRLHDELTSVRKTTRLLTSPLDIQQILEIVVRTICQALDMDAAGLRLLDEETGNLVLKATYGLSDAYINKGPVTARESELNIRALHDEVIIVEDMRTHPHFRRYHDDIVREGIIGSLSIGLIFRDKGIGILRLYSKRPRTFSETDISLAQTVAAQSAAAIVNARLYAESLAAERMSRQLRLAGAVQRHLIPQQPPQIFGWDLAGLFVPCYEVGGDFYDFVTISDRRLLLALGDVMGKGVPASLAMASLRSSLRAYSEEIDSLAELIVRVNRMFCRDTDPGEFATLFCAQLDTDTGLLTYCNCGHEPPLVINHDKSSTSDLTEGGTVLGIDPKASFDAHQHQLHSGDMLVMYTDGLVDAVNFQRESFGRPRAVQAALDSAHMPAEQAAKNILWLMRKFAGLTPRYDDTALVVLKKS